MGELSFFWHDYETFGRMPRRDRPAQFAGLRTDAELREIDAPVMCYCKPSPDVLPDPEACLLTGIAPQTCLERGLPEHAFAATIERELARPGTVGVGYNSIRFDDEVTRHLFWRNLIDPYAREWQNECSRWDLLDVLRCAYALRPEGIEWPRHDDGRPSFRLEHLSAANGLAHEAAHDALSDVRATVALARLLRSRQPRLWDYCLRLRKKDAVLAELVGAHGRGRPLLHVSGRYGAERGCLAIVWPLGTHPTNKNEVIVWDLAADPAELLTLGAVQIRERLFTPQAELPEGVTRLPIKTLHVNKSPVVIGKLETLSPAMAARWGIDVGQALRHAETAAGFGGVLDGLWGEVFTRPEPAVAADVDEDLYSGFIGREDRRALERLRAQGAARESGRQVHFADARLEELVFRYRARNFPEALDAAGQARWRQHCRERLQHGVAGERSLAAYFAQLDALAVGAADAPRTMLATLHEYGERLAQQVGLEHG